jgi:hypothetical protein
MPTDKQVLGDLGEKLIAKTIDCPGCKSNGKTLRTLPTNFKCADLICDFCGYLAQVKTATVKSANVLPKQILGAAWKPQHERMSAGIFFPLFIVLVEKGSTQKSLWYLPRDLQTKSMFVPRNPLKETARRAGWQGYMIDLGSALSMPTRLY